jgi:hypothetical protein
MLSEYVIGDVVTNVIRGLRRGDHTNAEQELLFLTTDAERQEVKRACEAVIRTIDAMPPSRD